jgi:dipeptidyl aminopeptidase/acylaminoacyl peptidase
MKPIRITTFILFVILFSPFTQEKVEGQKREMTFLDIIQMRGTGGAVSPDGKWFIYTISVPDWEKSNKFSDIYITTLIGDKTKQMTFTKDKNESSLKWYKDGSFFAFLSDRSENKNQIYFMRPEGDEAWEVTDDKFSVSSYGWSRDWKYLTYLSGSFEKRQIYIMPGEGGDTEKLTDHKTAISSYFWSPNSKKIYFVAPDSIDLLDKERKKRKFDVVIKDQIKIPSHLWEIDIETKKERRLTGGDEYSVLQSVISEDGTKIAFFGSPTKRYAPAFEWDVYLLDLNTNTISRITNNSHYGGNLSFSPDSKWLAFTYPDGEKEISYLRKIYIVPSEGGEVKKLLSNFNYEGWISFWSDDSRDIYFSAGVGVNIHLFKVSIDNNQIEQITNFSGYPFFVKDKNTGTFLVWHFDSENPRDVYYSVLENLTDRDKWIKLTNANPQVKDFLLGKYETIRWKSTDDSPIEGLLIKPINYNKDRKYPLIVQIHGGPHDACMNYFSDSWSDYVHIYAANDYVVFQPNYRGSTGYGEKFKKDVTPYFGLSLDDILTGVDYLIERGIVHPDSMGVMGWSAGADYSNSILVSTDHFKAISTGAGTVFDDKMDNYAKESPLKYIKNAKTPTLIHFGENDPIMPLRHGEVLYMALKKLGVPTEFIVYPNTGHGIYDMRYQMVKMQAEFYWFEKWIRGKEGWIDWKEMIETFEKK